MRRSTDPRFAPDNEVAFADGFPFLLASEVNNPRDFTPGELPLSGGKRAHHDGCIGLEGFISGCLDHAHWTSAI